MEKIAIVGAGLCGSLLSLYLAERGYQISVYEKRPDMRKAEVERGRSINLAISRRGVFALEKLNLWDAIRSKATPMYARMIHNLNASPVKQFYGPQEDEHIDALSRGDLNIDLLNFMDRHKNINIKFNQRVTDIDLDSACMTIFDEEEKESYRSCADVILATDGGPSIIRQKMIEAGVAQFSTEYLSHGYKELVLDSQSAKALDPNCLHIWPRDNFMLIALPNFAGSFTCTLFLSLQDQELSFNTLKTLAQIKNFFEQYFPDVYASIPDLLDQFLSNPVGELATLRGEPWHYKDKVLLLGDAAHAIVPFFGQGMNCAFEDCTVFDDLLEEGINNCGTLFSAFFHRRKKNTDAIAKMAIDNFYEMRSDTGKEKFILYKEVEKALMKRYGDQYVSRYVMISFRRDDYKLAEVAGALQHEFLVKICRKVLKAEDLNWDLVETELSLYRQTLEREKLIHNLC